MNKKYQFKNYSTTLKTGLIMGTIVLGFLALFELIIILLFLTSGHKKIHSIEIIIMIFTVVIVIALIWNCIIFKTNKSKMGLGIYYMLLITIGYVLFVILFSFNINDYVLNINHYYPNYEFWSIARAIVGTQIFLFAITWGLLIASGVMVFVGKPMKTIYQFDDTKKQIINYEQQELRYLSYGKSWLIASCVISAIFTFGFSLLWWLPVTIITIKRGAQYQSTGNLAIIIMILAVISLFFIFLPLGMMAAIYYGMFEPKNLDHHQNENKD
ncbi:hypothetical protein [Spiroplasma endosymbiont of Stenodema calcarata]|uniref:hypothetical protein n=1 Tax=Spiroplasma endosymbiont of Stenodema calcarata TaxID=3139328 RepID=UPI003CCAA02F